MTLSLKTFVDAVTLRGSVRRTYLALTTMRDLKIELSDGKISENDLNKNLIATLKRQNHEAQIARLHNGEVKESYKVAVLELEKERHPIRGLFLPRTINGMSWN